MAPRHGSPLPRRATIPPAFKRYSPTDPPPNRMHSREPISHTLFRGSFVPESQINPILHPPPARQPKSKNVAAPRVNQTRLLRQSKRRDFKALLKLENAAKLIEKIPRRGESLHLICNGHFASWDVVPAVLKITGNRIKRLDIATLGFNRANVAEMAALMDGGKIAELWLIYSCYFRSTSPTESEYLVETMQGRPARLAAIRNHAKLLLLELETGDCLTIETSANLRSCANIEQYVISNDRPLLEFHRTWIEDAIKDAETHGQKK